MAHFRDEPLQSLALRTDNQSHCKFKKTSHAHTHIQPHLTHSDIQFILIYTVIYNLVFAQDTTP